MIHTVNVSVFIEPFQFMHTGLVNKMDIMAGTQQFFSLKFLSDGLSYSLPNTALIENTGGPLI